MNHMWVQLVYKYAETKEEMMTKLSYDLYYVKNQLLFDLKIIFLTTEVVGFRRVVKIVIGSELFE